MKNNQPEATLFCLRHSAEFDAFLQGFSPLPAETAPVAEAPGRVLCADLTAPAASPPETRSTRDGFALRSADPAKAASGSPVRLRITGECRVGEQPARGPAPGEAWRVFTGSALPPGADAVIAQEDALIEESHIRVSSPLPAGTHLLPAGADMPQGALLARGGRRLRPQDIGLLAQFYESVRVHRRPVLGILSSGDEFLCPGSPALLPEYAGKAAGGALLLEALACKLGGRALRLGVCADDPPSLRRGIEAALPEGSSPCDVLVVIGGSSGGLRDYSARVIASLPGCRAGGQSRRVSGGNPLVFARIGDLGLWNLPGHMLALFTAAQIFLAPLLRRLSGLADENAEREGWIDETVPARIRARLGRSLPSRGEAPSHYPVVLGRNASGLCAWPIALGTGKNVVLRDMAGWVTVPGGGQGLRRGRMAEVRLFL